MKIMKKLCFCVIHSALMSLPISSYAQLDDIFNVLKKIAETSSETGSDESSAIAVEINAFITKLNKSGGTNELRNTPDGELERIQALIPKRLGPLGEQVQRVGGEARNRLGNEYQQLNILKAEIGNEIQRRFKEARAQEERNVSEAREALIRAREAEDEGIRIRAAEEDRKAMDPSKTADALSNENWQKFLSKILKSVEENDGKGKAEAAKSKTKYIFSEVKDEMTLQRKVKAVSEGVIGSSKYGVELFCNQKKLIAAITIVDASFPQSAGIVKGRVRINGQVTSFNYALDKNWRNVITLPLGEVNNGRLSDLEYFALNKSSMWSKISVQNEPLGAFNQSEFNCQRGCSLIVRRAFSPPLYDLATEIPTSAGTLFIAIPPYEPNVRKVMATCNGTDNPPKSINFFNGSDFIPLALLYK